jgi:hypothetical protein
MEARVKDGHPLLDLAQIRKERGKKEGEGLMMKTTKNRNEAGK